MIYVCNVHNYTTNVALLISPSPCFSYNSYQYAGYTVVYVAPFLNSLFTYMTYYINM